MRDILEAIQAGAPGDQLGAVPIPDSYRAAVVRKSETGMFEGMG